MIVLFWSGNPKPARPDSKAFTPQSQSRTTRGVTGGLFGSKSRDNSGSGKPDPNDNSGNDNDDEGLPNCPSVESLETTEKRGDLIDDCINNMKQLQKAEKKQRNSHLDRNVSVNGRDFKIGRTKT